MKRITLAMMVFGMTAVAHSQTPPTPPPARRAPVPAPAARPADSARPTPMAPLPSMAPLAPMSIIDREEMQRAMEAARESREFMRYDFDREAIREQSRRATEEVRHMTEQNRHFAEDARRMAADAMADHRAFGYTPTPMAAPVPMTMPSMVAPPMSMRYSEGGFGKQPPAPWAQGDPGDSLYRVASEANSRGDYRRAAQLFADLIQRHPRSVYVGDAMYWEAYDRYRLGSTEELRTAAKVLENMTARAGELRRRGGYSDGDVQGLKARVYGELARRGDTDAGAKLQALVKQAGGTLCDREDQAIRAEALSALAQTDAAAANPIFKKVFEKRDECSADLRSNAVRILGRRTDADAVSMLIGVAKNDANIEVRAQAISFLPRLPGDAPIAALDDILKSDTSSRIQRSAIRALQSSDNPRTRQGLRTLIERKDVSENLRYEVLNNLDKERTTQEEIAWLRGQYAKVDTDRFRTAIIDAVARFGGPENEQWVIAVAKNANEPAQARSVAWSRVMRMNLPINDLIKLYDAADSRNTRDQLINALGNRNEPEATDKLVEIAKIRTDPNSSTRAINALQRKKDPRTLRLLADLLEKP